MKQKEIKTVLVQQDIRMKLNVGRCSRCIARIMKINAKGKLWKYCKVKNNFCRYISGRCKCKPSGITYSEYMNLKN